MVFLAFLLIPLIIALIFPFLERKKKESWILATIASLLLVILSLAIPFTASQDFNYFKEVLELDPYTTLYLVFFTISMSLVFLGSKKSVFRIPAGPVFYSLALFSLLGLVSLAYAIDLITIIAAWVLASVASYAIVAISKDKESAEGALKYALMGSASSTLLVLAVVLAFALLNGTSLTLPQTPLIQVALPTMLFLLAAVGYKIGVVPFHGWLPDTYGKVNPILISFVAPLSKAMALVVLYRLSLTLAPLDPTAWFTTMALFSIITMLYGNISALVQKDAQKIMAYSSIAHTGYFLVGITALSLVDQSFRVIALIGLALQYAAYSLGKVGSFIALTSYKNRVGSLTLEKLRGLGTEMKLTSAGLTILLLSLMGMPPLIGFWGKLYIFLSVAYTAPWLTLIALLNTAISVAYYAKIIKTIYFEKEETRKIIEEKNTELASIIISAILSILLGLGLGELIVQLYFNI